MMYGTVALTLSMCTLFIISVILDRVRAGSGPVLSSRGLIFYGRDIFLVHGMLTSGGLPPFAGWWKNKVADGLVELSKIR
jgi:hypothetical protein